MKKILFLLLVLCTAISVKAQKNISLANQPASAITIDGNFYDWDNVIFAGKAANTKLNSGVEYYQTGIHQFAAYMDENNIYFMLAYEQDTVAPMDVYIGCSGERDDTELPEGTCTNFWEPVYVDYLFEFGKGDNFIENPTKADWTDWRYSSLFKFDNTIGGWNFTPLNYGMQTITVMSDKVLKGDGLTYVECKIPRANLQFAQGINYIYISCATSDIESNGWWTDEPTGLAPAATMNDYIISYQTQLKVTEVKSNQDTYEITANLTSQKIWPVLLDNTTFDQYKSYIVSDFRPNNDDRHLYIWPNDETYAFNPNPTGKNFFQTESNGGYLALNVAGGLGWAGAGFFVSAEAIAPVNDLINQMKQNPSDYGFHMAFKSTDNYSHYFAIFGQGDAGMKWAIGNNMDAPTHYTAPRTGEWYEIDIKMSDYAAILSDITTSTTDGINIFYFGSEGIDGAQLNLDACYFYQGKSSLNHGIVTGTGTYKYGDVVTLYATPYAGYKFTQWSDGNTDNPRTIVVTGDKYYEAIFEELPTPTTNQCGENLYWEYNDNTLTISGTGAMYDYYYYEVPWYNYSESISTLVLKEGVTSIGENAFSYCSKLMDIYSYAVNPPGVYSSTFSDVSKHCYIHVPAGSLRDYQVAYVWRDFFHIYEIGALPGGSGEVGVTVTNNYATFSWPANPTASSYTLEIKKNGVLFCSLIFNSMGQLVGMNFAPSRRAANAAAAESTAYGYSFVVNGLEDNTTYNYTFSICNAEGQVIETHNGEFVTQGSVVTDLNALQDATAIRKTVKSSQLFIIRDGKMYNAQGAEMQ